MGISEVDINVQSSNSGETVNGAEATLVRKIDWRIIPTLFFAYFLQFLDKVTVNYANVMGLQKDLQMQGQDFSWTATAFFIGYIVAELPQDDPEQANFLNHDEKRFIQERLEADKTITESEDSRLRLLGDSLLDPQTWLLVLLTLCITIPSGVITTFSAVLIHSFGFDSKQSALLNMPSGVVSIFATILSTWAVVKQAPRWLSIVGLLIPALVGGALLSFEGIGHSAGSLAGIYLVNFIVAPLAIIYNWVGANYNGHTQKVTASAIVSAAFGIANIIGPQTYQAKDAPGYLPAKIALMVVIAAAIPITLALRVLYGHRNRTRVSGGFEYCFTSRPLTAPQQTIPFTILERDTTGDTREQGWAITLHWALPLLENMLPRELIAGIQKCQVNAKVAENDTRDFKLINLKDCSEHFNTSSGKRWRLDRGRLRLALLDGLDGHILWNKHVESIEHQKDVTKLQCSDGTSHIADIVIGADGSRSAIRKFLSPETHAVTPLPFRMLGVRTELTEEQLAPLCAIDPLLFQGSEPGTGNFLYCSLLGAPTQETSTYTVQLNISWPKSSNNEKEVFSDNASRLAAFKLRAQGFDPCLRNPIESIAAGTPVVEITLADREFVPWDGLACVTLVGDAAHPMTMFRGEAANHGILDAYDLLKHLQLICSGKCQKQDAMHMYKRILTERAPGATLASRRACEDAHHYPVNKDSPLVTERTMPPQFA
ncbi:FAD/NAD(P)-binding domain-containing protein, partial [Aureobasidium melanogenum]